MTRLVERARTWIRRLRRLPHLDAIDRAMDDEMRHHIDCEIAERVRAGEPRDTARRNALRDFGNVELVKEEARDARGLRPLEDLLADARYAGRIMRRHPSQTTAVIVTFALGVAAAGSIFAVVYGVLLRALPYADPNRLVAVWERNVARNRDRNVVSVANFERWRDASGSFEAMAALVPRSVTIAEHGSVPERVMGAEVSPGYFHLLGVRPALGRDFATADEQAAGARVTILSYDFWKRRFGADPGVIGRSLALGEGACRIVGVMPEGFEPPRFGWLGVQELWFPFAATSENGRWGRFLLVVARLRPDVTIERARAEMTSMADRLAADDAGNRGWSVSIVPLALQITGDVRTALRTLLAAVGLLFLIAVANVATLTATATRRRAQELAIRRSLGATDRRVFRQLVTQHMLLGLAGAIVGLAAIPPCVGLLRALAPPSLPRLPSIQIDAPTLFVTLSIVALAILAFSVTASAPRRPPAIRVAAEEFCDGATTRHRRVGGGLVVFEIAVALTLGIMAALMARSVLDLRSVNLGFDAGSVIAARVALTGPSADGPAARTFFDDLLERIRARPGVQSAGLISIRPLGGLGTATVVADPGRPRDKASNEFVADVRFVNGTLFESLRIPVRAGTTFDERDGDAGPISVVVSENLARALWPGQPAVGHQLFLALYNGITGTVIGVVGDVHFVDPRTPVRPAAYLSHARFPSDTRDLVVRASGDPSAIVPALRAEVAALAPGVPLYLVEPMTDAVDVALAQERFTAFVLSAFAGIALLLGGVGVFGVIAGEVARRRQEIGLRMALGAGRSRVTWMMLRQTMTRAAIGIAAGVVLTMWLARSMTSLLFGVAPLDPASYASAIVAVLALALAATLLPVVSALRRTPIAALREG